MEKDSVQQYQALAVEAWQQAQSATTPEARNIFAVIATAYLSLAKHAASRDERDKTRYRSS